MSIREKIRILVQQTKNKDLLQWVYETLDESNSKKSFLEGISELQMNNYKESSKQADKGKTISHADAMKKVQRWKKLKK